jgi:hypothetical protein
LRSVPQLRCPGGSCSASNSCSGVVPALLHLLSQMRSTRSALADVDGGGGSAVQLGVPGEPFTFEAHARRGSRVTTAVVSGEAETAAGRSRDTAIAPGAC